MGGKPSRGTPRDMRLKGNRYGMPAAPKAPQPPKQKRGK